jgi:hypothetical protein
MPFEPICALGRTKPFEPICALGRTKLFEPICALGRTKPFEPICALGRTKLFEPICALGRNSPFEPICAAGRPVAPWPAWTGPVAMRVNIKHAGVAIPRTILLKLVSIFNPFSLAVLLLTHVRLLRSRYSDRYRLLS